MEPCEVSAKCKQSPEHKGPEARCADCMFSPSNVEWIAGPGGLSTFHRRGVNNWHPIDKKAKHPVLLALAAAEKVAKAKSKLAAKKSRNIKKMKIVYRAAKAEQATEKHIIHATKNSGRSHKDGDHVMSGFITLDTKSQDVDNPIVKMVQLEKVREDAKRASKELGGLVLRNRYGVGVVVLAEEDFALLVRKANGPEAKS